MKLIDLAKRISFAAIALSAIALYIGGAVQKEGYYVVSQGCTYLDAIQAAGTIEQSHLMQISSTIVVEGAQIIVPYSLDGKIFDCTNVNGALVTSNFSIENVPKSVVQKISSYIKTNGNIKNKDQLKDILTPNEYQQNYYKFFVDKTNYESN